MRPWLHEKRKKGDFLLRRAPRCPIDRPSTGDTRWLDGLCAWLASNCRDHRFFFVVVVRTWRSTGTLLTTCTYACVSTLRWSVRTVRWAARWYWMEETHRCYVNANQRCPVGCRLYASRQIVEASHQGRTYTYTYDARLLSTTVRVPVWYVQHVVDRNMRGCRRRAAGPACMQARARTWIHAA